MLQCPFAGNAPMRACFESVAYLRLSGDATQSWHDSCVRKGRSRQQGKGDRNETKSQSKSGDRSSRCTDVTEFRSCGQGFSIRPSCQARRTQLSPIHCRDGVAQGSRNTHSDNVGCRVLLAAMGAHHETATTTGRTDRSSSDACFSREVGFSNAALPHPRNG